MTGSKPKLTGGPAVSQVTAESAAFLLSSLSSCLLVPAKTSSITLFASHPAEETRCLTEVFPLTCKLFLLIVRSEQSKPVGEAPSPHKVKPVRAVSRVSLKSFSWIDSDGRFFSFILCFEILHWKLCILCYNRKQNHLK